MTELKDLSCKIDSRKSFESKIKELRDLLSKEESLNLVFKGAYLVSNGISKNRKGKESQLKNSNYKILLMDKKDIFLKINYGSRFKDCKPFFEKLIYFYRKGAILESEHKIMKKYYDEIKVIDLNSFQDFNSLIDRLSIKKISSSKISGYY